MPVSNSKEDKKDEKKLEHDQKDKKIEKFQKEKTEISKKIKENKKLIEYQAENYTIQLQRIKSLEDEIQREARRVQ